MSRVEDCAAWVVRTETGPYSQLASIGEQVIAVTENDVVALEVAGGRELWSRQGEAAASVTAAGSRVLVTEGGERMIALDAVTAPAQPLLHWPGSDLIVVAEDSLVVAAAADTGEPAWTLPLAPRRQLVNVDAAHIAVVLPSRLDILDRQTGEAVRSLATPLVSQIRPAEPGAQGRQHRRTTVTEPAAGCPSCSRKRWDLVLWRRGVIRRLMGVTDLVGRVRARRDGGRQELVMLTVVVFESLLGNTRRVAGAIADGTRAVDPAVPVVCGAAGKVAADDEEVAP